MQKIVTKPKVKIFPKPLIDLGELIWMKSKSLKSPFIDLTPKSIQAMVDRKIMDDLLKFRSCCSDTIASR